MRVLANDGITESGKAMLEEAGYTVSTQHHAQDDLAFKLNEGLYDILLVRSATKVTSDVIDACPNLKMIGRGGVGTDNIDTDHARANGIKVFNTPAASSDSVAELVIGQMFAVSRYLHESAEKMRTEDFKKLKKAYSEGTELRGKTIGIIGFGRIGRSLASYALGLGMNVLAVDIEERQAGIILQIADQFVTVGVEVTTDMHSVLPLCDFVSVHMPLQDNGDSVITSNEINLMKDGVVVINAARGGVINESDLIDALNSGKIAAAALDVFEDEPNPDKRLLSHPRIFATPHVGAGTLEAQERIGTELATIIKDHYGTFNQ